MLTVNPNGLDMAAITPGNGAKFSPNLYNWLRAPRHKRYAREARVYRDTEGVLWIGMLVGQELFGAKLMTVLCTGSRAGTYANQNVRAVEVADFWPRYMAFGRCAIDPEHVVRFTNDDTRWATYRDKRACVWCGKASQTLKRWTEVVHHQSWVTEGQ